MNTVYTFYSYKGGVGRSMAMANVAALLAKWGHSVLVIDWDLEAPGLEKYFMREPSVVEGTRAETPGVVDIVTAFARGERLAWEECLLRAYPFGKDSPPVHILGAGQDTPEYVERLQTIDWRRIFEQGFGAYLEEMRDAWLAEYEFVLIDSRTGFTDIGGVCTIHLPDVLVLIFTANEQSLNGVIDVAQRAQANFARLPEEFGRRKRRVGPDERLERKLLSVPIPSRFEYNTEFKSAANWLKKFADRLGHLYADWLPRGTDTEEVLKQLFVPYIPFWSFGENLPVVQEGTTNPRSIGFAYELLARLLEHDLDWREVARPEQAAAERTPEQVEEESERVYAGLGAEDMKVARRVFTGLVTVAPLGLGLDARGRAPLSEFDGPSRRAVKTLADARVLKLAHDTAAGEEVVEIAEDSTLRHWGRLKKWLDEDRDYLLWRQHLRAGVAAWEKAGRDPAYLLGGSALREAERFLAERGDELSGNEKSFVELSRNEEARARRNLRLRRAAVLGALLVVAFVGAFYTYSAYKQQREAQLRALEEQRAFSLAVQATARGVDMFQREDLQGAIAAYREALQYKSNYAPAHYNLGEALLNLANSNPDKAEAERLREEAINEFGLAIGQGLEPETKQQAEQFIASARDPIKPRYDVTPTPTPAPTPTPRPDATPSATPRPTPSPSPTPVIATNITPRVYIQATSDSLGFARLCGSRLAKLGYTMPPLATVANVPQSTEVRYYRRSDAKDAEQIVALLRSWGVPDAQSKYLVGYESSTAVRPRHFEIWFSRGVAPASGAGAQ
jgi:hypothetical protein